MSGISNIRIVLSGPESSGKSTLARRLAEHFSLPWAPEYARHFLESGGAYPDTANALANLTRAHHAWQLEHVPEGASFGIFDTDLLNYCVWADVAFGVEPPELAQAWDQERHHIHLLCSPDLPWARDPLREYPDLESRHMLFLRYQSELDRCGIRHQVIHGQGEARFMHAVRVVESVLGL